MGECVTFAKINKPIFTFAYLLEGLVFQLNDLSTVDITHAIDIYHVGSCLANSQDVEQVD